MYLILCIFIHNDKIEKVEVTKCLGLLIDENFSWDKHIDHVVGKMATGLFALKQIKECCGLKTLKFYIFYWSTHILPMASVYMGQQQKNLK